MHGHHCVVIEEVELVRASCIPFFFANHRCRNRAISALRSVTASRCSMPSTLVWEGLYNGREASGNQLCSASPQRSRKRRTHSARRRLGGRDVLANAGRRWLRFGRLLMFPAPKDGGYLAGVEREAPGRTGRHSAFLCERFKARGSLPL